MNTFQKTYYNKNNHHTIEAEDDDVIKTIDILSRFGNSKLLSDTSLNKYYKKYIQKQAHIQHQQKIYELIEKMDDTKAFNSLKAEYLKEKVLLQNLHNNKKKENKRVIYTSNFINLKNYKEKLHSLYKLAAQDLNFMSSLMNYLGNRPKKIFKPKINKKLEALSRGKLSSPLKNKESSKQDSKANTLYNYNPQNSETVIKTNPYLKYFFGEQNEHNSINSFGNKKEKQIFNIKSKTNENFYSQFYGNKNLRRKSIGYNLNNRGYTQRFLGKTKSTNFGLTRYNYFINNTNPNEEKYTFSNNLKNENSDSQNDNSNPEEKHSNNNAYNNYNLPLNKTKSKFNSQTSLFSLNNNKSRRRSKNSAITKINKETASTFNTKQNQNTLENVTNKKFSIKDSNRINNLETEQNFDDDLSILLNLKYKTKDKKTIKNRLVKIYKNTMNEFLQKIKDEEKDLSNNSNKISTLLNKFKKYGNLDKSKNQKKGKQKNILTKNKTLSYTLQKRNTTSSNITQNERNNVMENIKNDKKNNIMAKTFYPSWGKSKYSIPYINKIVYGEENILDPFEQLQKDLFYEVKNEIRKTNDINIKKGKKIISINGKEILNRFKKNNYEEMEESEIINQ